MGRRLPFIYFRTATCLAPVFINRKTNQIGLGHLPYVYIDRTKKNYAITKEETKLLEARERLARDGSDWVMLLFGGQPYDSSDEKIDLAETHARKVIEMFSEIGVECSDQTNKDPVIDYEGIIVDPITKEIQVAYSDK